MIPNIWPGPGLGPSPGWGPVRVGAHMGPYGPIWAHKGPYVSFQKWGVSGLQMICWDEFRMILHAFAPRSQKNIVFFFESAPQNDAGPSGNYVKNSFLNPKRAKFDEQSEIGHVHWHQNLQVRAQPSRKTYLFKMNYFQSFLIKNN